MYITTSKNADAKLRSIAKNLALPLHGSRYMSRSDRTMDRISSLAQRESEDSILVLMRKEDGVHAMKYEQEGDMWNWNPNAMRISHITANKREFDLPVVFEAKTKEAKEVAQFLQLRDSIISGLYTDCEKIKISALKGTLRIIHEKEDLLKCSYEWIKWQKE